jgi:two-component system phosphate regulon sensor histidine kinase PhoR
MEALDGLHVAWLRVGPALQILDASLPALEMFGSDAGSQTVLALTRSARIEALAAEILAGARGPWEVGGTLSHPTLSVRGVPLEDGSALLQLDDVSELRRLESVRADFVANLAHELRTPVASLSLAAETLSGGLLPEDQERFITRIADETRYIEGLLRTVSELAFLEDSVKLQVSPFRLWQTVQDSSRRVASRDPTARVENRVPQALELNADPIRIAEVLQNLLENALRYTPDGASVVVGADESPTEVTAWVADEGPGIPPADLPRVFERFYKVDRARTRQGDGSGLGLAICKHLVTAHGGRIWAEPGASSGTTIRFTIPRSP